MTPTKTFWGSVAALIATASALLAFWGVYRSETDRMPIFEEDVVYFNQYDEVNDEFIAYLRSKNGEKISINTIFDFSPFSFENYNVLNECNNAYFREDQTEEAFLAEGGSFDILEGKIFNRPLRIPHHHRWGDDFSDGCPSTLEIIIESPRSIAPLSYGGTGVVRMTIRGNFIVHQSLSGATETLKLREVDVDEN